MQTSSQMAVIRSARMMSVILLLAACGVVALALAATLWMFTDPQALQAVIGPVHGSDLTTMTVGQQIALLTLGVTSLLGWALALWWAHRMFATLTKGAPHEAVPLARRIVVALWVLLLWQILAPALGSLVATWYFPAGQRSVSIGLSFGHAGTLLSALIASSMAKALQFGAELWQDHKEII